MEGKGIIDKKSPPIQDFLVYNYNYMELQLIIIT